MYKGKTKEAKGGKKKETSLVKVKALKNFPLGQQQIKEGDIIELTAERVESLKFYGYVV